MNLLKLLFYVKGQVLLLGSDLCDFGYVMLEAHAQV